MASLVRIFLPASVLLLALLPHLAEGQKDRAASGQLRELIDHWQRQDSLRHLQIKAWQRAHPEAQTKGPARLDRIAPNGGPVWVQPTNADAARSIGADSLLAGGGAGWQLSGSGQWAGLWGFGEVLQSHEQLSGRVTFGESLNGSSSHSTHVAGTIIGSGQGRPSAKGMAPSGKLTVFNTTDDRTEVAQEVLQNNLTLSNHSYDYSAGWRGNVWYGDTIQSFQESVFFGLYYYAAAWDTLCYQAPYLVMVKAAGNQRDDGPPAQGDTYYYNNYSNNPTALTYDTTDVRRSPEKDGGSDGYDCISGRGNAKNILTVGEVEDLGSYQGPGDVQISPRSSWGPTDDGRIKPDLVANGSGVLSAGPDSSDHYFSQSGSSNATASVTGGLLLLRELYTATHLEAPTAATLKGLLLHTAREAGPHPGPDYIHGWGLLNAPGAAHLITRDTLLPRSILEDTLAGQDSDTLTFIASGQPLRITLCYTDVPGNGAYLHDDASPKLVHDLDMHLEAGGQSYFPYRLDPTQPAKGASTGDNDRDNVEQIYQANPVAGQSYDLILEREDAASKAQAYSLMISGMAGVYYAQCASGCPAEQLSTWNSRPDGQGMALASGNEAKELRIGAEDSAYLNTRWQPGPPYPLLAIESGGELYLDTAARLHAGKRIHNEGTLQLANAAVLYQHGSENHNTGEGHYRVERHTGELDDHLRYQYWSSPVDTATMGSVFQGANSADFYQYEAGWLSQVASQAMEPGRGYATTPTQDALARDFSETRTFTGRINTGDLALKVALDSGEWVLAGNPYPGPIANADFVNANPDLLGSLYYYDHETAPTAGTDTFYNEQADYLVWNPMASLGSLSETTNDFTETAQGMMVQAIAPADSLHFHNSMRGDTVNQQFFKMPQNPSPAAWLGLYRKGQRVEQLVVGFTQGATYGPDRLYDAPDLDLGGSAFYAWSGSKAFAITGLPIQALRRPGQQALNLQADPAGAYSVKLDSLRAWPSGVALHLRVPARGTSTVLKAGRGLSFSLPAGGITPLLLKWRPQSLHQPDIPQGQAPRLYYDQGRAWLKLPPATSTYTLRCYAPDGRLLKRWHQAAHGEAKALPSFKPGLYLLEVRAAHGYRWQGHWLQPRP